MSGVQGNFDFGRLDSRSFHPLNSLGFRNPPLPSNLSLSSVHLLATTTRGSTYQLLKYFPNLTVNIYNFDTSLSPQTSLLGPSYTSYAQTQQSLPISISTPHVGYRIIDVSTLTEQDAIDDVLNQRCWAAIVIHGNATSSWRDGVEGGVEHEAQGSMGIYYEGARYYQVLLLYLRPFVSVACGRRCRRSESLVSRN